MQKLVEEYLARQKAEKEAKYDRKKSDLVSKLSLFEKEYTNEEPVNGVVNGYPNREIDPATGKIRYFKNIPISLSDEEYNAILEYQKNENITVTYDDSPISGILKGVAIAIFAITFLAGIIVVFDLGFVITIAIWVVGFVMGMSMLGFSKIISLLTEIRDKI